jgi:hypothetical protein
MTFFKSAIIFLFHLENCVVDLVVVHAEENRENSVELG